ncbi:SDR family NAD(P)-dependent oxidoreductase [Corallococcus sp. BB11-1]|uniref:type I polyketide synthase n=1 Tax=Corallococcus sp. BB11-1 TaxID=2996783 RepID=UPI0022717DBE|nr:SDR family NAD(P)-dependent oxidoreductase [Corallococcus sp. BB11-1]MCY1033274.1 SDR family NAD(P)-dependent oxidoreductase [Corallococcus sp. BB11-1]
MTPAPAVEPRPRSDDDVAIIGMACRFPGANTPWEFWDNLARGRSSVREVPAERWDGEAFYSRDPDAPNRGVSKWAGFIEDADKFDAPFFRISPREAELMDPQQRILLELAWSCMEDAGYAASRLKGSQTGVYVGVCNFDYKEALEKSVATIEAHLSTGTYGTLIPNRISYEFDFKGPSIPVDTACSSSLVALHEAVRALQRGECAQALVGGVSVLCSPTYFVAFSKAGMLSPDGACMTFDHRANGYVRGEGAGLVLVKPLRQALADGDRIRGIIKGTAINHGGKAASVTSPSAFAQSRVIVDAVRRAGVAPERIRYLEAHGTGTPKGDPIELHGIQRAFQSLSGASGAALEEASCGIGSAKTNIGHLEAAAGIAGLIKVLLSMEHRALPGLLHFERLNPRIRLEGTPFYVVDSLQEWKASPDDAPRCAGVSSFGFGGVNAHVVVEEYREPLHEPSGASTPQAIVLSARTQDRLQAHARALLAFLEAPSAAPWNLADIAFTLQRRESLEVRAAFETDSLPGLKAGLDRLARGDTDEEGLFRGKATAAPQDADAARPLAEDANLRELIRGWVSGLPVDWRTLRTVGPRPRLVSLPTYPFERLRYWLLPGAEASARSLKDVWHVRPAWTRRPLAPPPPGVSGGPGADVLCLTLLEATTAEALHALPGIRAVALPPLAAASGSEGWVEACGSAMETIREALTRDSPARLLFLSDTAPDQAAMLFAMLRSLHKELGLPARWYAWAPEAGAPSPLRSILADADQDREVGGAMRLRFVDGAWEGESQDFTFEPVPARARPPDQARGGVFWIPGGNGGIGWKLAEHLADTRDATVIVSGRSREGLRPDRPRGTPGARGAIHFLSGDCTQRPDMERVLATVLATHGRLTGVIHCAGVLRDRSFFSKTRDDVHAVLAPKVEGARVLDEVTRHLPLECFILFSSLTGLWGNAGQTDYAAANALLGLLARRRQAQVLRGERSGTSMVLHWPYWEEGGMRLPEALVARLETSLGMRPLKDAEGLALFDHVLATRAEEAAFTCGDLVLLRKALVGHVRPPTEAAAPPRSSAPPPAATDAASLREAMTRLVGELTGNPPEGLDRGAHFVELGVDSILLQALVRRVNDAHGTSLGILDLHNHPSIEELSALVEGLVGGGVEAPGPAAVVAMPPAPVDAPVDAFAIVGIDLKVPGASSLEAFWELVGAGERKPTPYPEARWALLPPALVGGLRREDCQGFFLEDALGFDHRLFGISPREAMLMDPQQRLLLHSVWHALEHAGYSREEFARRRTAVFLSIDAIDYEHLVAHDAVVDEFSGTGVSRYIAANRISHVFNLRGVSESVDTACSSFFVGLARAMDAIRNGTAEQAVVAAVQMNLLPHRFQVLRERGLLSRGDTTRPFDRDSDGFIRGEGVGAVVVKPLQRALEDRDRVYGVIRGVGVWHAGMSMGVTAPNSRAHQEAMKQALRNAAVPVDSLGYVEAHGTGMPLGDASELDALQQVFRELGRDASAPCVLGAAKAALGHLEAASGVAALAKALLALQHGRVPGLSHLRSTHPGFNPEGPLRLARAEQPLSPGADGAPPRAGLLSYGLGGVSAFLVLEAPPVAPAPAVEPERPGLFVLSSQSPRVLEAYSRTVLQFLSRARASGRALDFEQFIEAYLHQRDAMTHRLAVVAAGFADLEAKLERHLAGQATDGVYTSQGAPKPAERSRDFASQVAAEAWHPLAEAWIRGEDVPWPAPTRPRAAWPTYPFDTERTFWISPRHEAR